MWQKPRWETGLESANDVTHWKRARRIWGILKKSVELRPASGEDGWLSLARGGLGQVSHGMGGGRWKSQNRKNVYLNPYVEEPLNPKVIKSFVPQLRSRKCFFVFRDSYVLCYIYIWTLYVHFTHSRIWLWYKVWTPYPPSNGLNSNTTVLLEGWIWR